jgi:hypothetical protein
MNNMGVMMNGQPMNSGFGQQIPSFNAPMNGQQSPNFGSPMNGQQMKTAPAFTFVKMSVFSSINCQSTPINSTSIESGKCYTYGRKSNFNWLADMCRMNKFSKQFCDQLSGNAKTASFKFQCIGNGVQGNYFSDSRCTTSTSIPVNANTGACNQGIMYTCSATEEQTIVNGSPNLSFLYNDAAALDAVAVLIIVFFNTFFL